MTRYLVADETQRTWITSSPWWRSTAPARWTSSPATSSACTARNRSSYRHPSLEPIFSDTYGIPIYQEQIMRAAVDLAGYTRSESDDLRKAISKKQTDKIAKAQAKSSSRARSNAASWTRHRRRPSSTTGKSSPRYGFNKSHAADYGVIAVQTGYLKAHYTGRIHDRAAVGLQKRYRQGCLLRRRLPRHGHRRAAAGCQLAAAGISAIEDGPGRRPTSAIRFGLGAVKNVGQARSN